MVRRDALPVLTARGFVAAFGAWKALLLLLAFNALLAAALARPVASALHETLDEGPAAADLLASSKAVFWSHFQRTRPDVAGDLSAWDDLATGGRVGAKLLMQRGAAGALVWLGLLSALSAGLFAGGFAGRFGADKDRGSLAAFGTDCGRFAFSSLVLSALSLGALVLAYRYVFAATASLYDANELRYEWEAVGLLLLRLLAFLVVAGYLRLVILYARASMGLTRNGSPFLALATGAGFVVGRPIRTMLLELIFGFVGLLPLAVWGIVGPVWDGKDPGSLALVVALQQLAVGFRIAARTAHLGAASAYLRVSREAAAPKASGRPAAEAGRPETTKAPPAASAP